MLESIWKITCLLKTYWEKLEESDFEIGSNPTFWYDENTHRIYEVKGSERFTLYLLENPETRNIQAADVYEDRETALSENIAAYQPNKKDSGLV